MPARPDDGPLDSLAELVREHRSELVRVARREGLGAEDAVDCVHDALCTYAQITLRGDLPAKTSERVSFLAGIVRNTARNKRRRHHLARIHEPLEAAERADGPTVEALVAHAEECVRLRACVNRLCKTQRTVVLMRLLDERPGEDVATALGITRGYVDVLLHRAKASLFVCMTASDEADGEP
jgi:RNA polymerase sigma-70 factor (ECF subfamily)